MQKQRLWLPSEKLYVQKHYQNTTIREMAEQLNRSYHSVEGYLLRKSLMGKRCAVKRTARLKEMISEVELAYLAGIMDGEGTITITKHYSRKQHKHYLRVSLQIANCSYPLKQKLAQWGFLARVDTNSSGHKYWRIQLSGWHIAEPLRKLKPYLIIKKEHVSLVLRYIELRQEQRFHSEPSQEMLDIYQTIHSLNKRGSRFEDEMARAESTT